MITLETVGTTPDSSAFVADGFGSSEEFEKSSVPLPANLDATALHLPIPANRFKAACRRGLPARFRASLWLNAIARLENNAEEVAFAGTAAHVKELDRKWLALVDRTFHGDALAEPDIDELGCPDTVLAPLSEAGRAAAARVLAVFDATHTVGFSPILCRIVPRLLLYCSEGMTYHIIDEMWKRRPFFFPKNRNEWAALLTCLGHLVQKFFPQTYTYMNGCGAFEHHGARRLMLHVFEDLLPLHCVLRLLDTYIPEGQKVIFRIILGLIKLCKRPLKDSGAADGSAIWAFVENFAKTQCDADALMASAFAQFYRRPGRGFRRSHVDEAMRRQLNDSSLRAHEVVGAFTPPQKKKARGNEGSHHAAPLRGASYDKSELPMLEEHRALLAKWLPNSFSSLHVTLLYDSARDGSSLGTLYRLNNPDLRFESDQVKLKRLGPARLLIVHELGTDHVAGVFSTEPWRHHNEGYGSGQNFVFRLQPDPKAFYWNAEENKRDDGDDAAAAAAGAALKHMLCSHEYLAAGGRATGVGVALQLDADLLDGHSSPCDTYQNEVLFSSSHFQARRVQVYGLGM